MFRNTFSIDFTLLGLRCLGSDSRPCLRWLHASAQGWQQRGRSRCRCGSGAPLRRGDGHGLRPTDEFRTEFAREVESLPEGVVASAKGGGFDFSVGAPLAASERFTVIPVGVVGYTKGEYEVCIDTFCDSDSYTEANFGGGLVACISAASGVGLHVGVRYTRHYGVALTVGITFGSN